MTREQRIRDRIRGWEDTIEKLDVGDQARTAFFSSRARPAGRRACPMLSPGPVEYSSEMVQTDIAATEARLQALKQQPPSPDRDSDIGDAEVMLAEHRELLANL